MSQFVKDDVYLFVIALYMYLGTIFFVYAIIVNCLYSCLYTDVSQQIGFHTLKQNALATPLKEKYKILLTRPPPSLWWYRMDWPRLCCLMMMV